MRISNIIKTADYFTLGNYLCGLVSIFFSINQKFTYAAIMLLVSVVFDFLDGKIARYTKKANLLGKELDSLADTVSFGLAPAIFGYMNGLNDFLSIGVLFFFMIAGTLRLAKFNILGIDWFEGVPITINGILFPAIYFLLSYFGMPFSKYILIVYFAMACLMLSQIKIKKV